MKEVLKKLFSDYYGKAPESINVVQAHASDRLLYRLRAGDTSCIGVINDNVPENLAFTGFAECFLRFNLPVPKVYKISEDKCAYLIEDLGDTTLYDLATKHKENEAGGLQVEDLYTKAVELLPRFQIEAGKHIDYSLCFSGSEYDRNAMLYDIDYFHKNFLERITGVQLSSDLNSELNSLTEFIDKADRSFFLYRDFQARNIMVRGGELYFIDFQSGRRGALQYDLASLIYQSQAKLSDALREKLIRAYIKSASSYIKLGEEQFREFFDGFVLIRLIQVLGTYGRFGLGEKKEYFLKGIPVALKTILAVLESNSLPIKLPRFKETLKTVNDVFKGDSLA